MKNINRIILSAFLLLLTASFGCVPIMSSDSRSSAGRLVELDLSRASIVLDEDSHGGFHGDGTWLLILGCKDVSTSPFTVTDEHGKQSAMTVSIADSIASNKHWHSLPMSGNVSELVKRTHYENSCESFFPEITNGYYYFKDRSSEAVDRYSDSEVYNRYSFNYTLAVYDSDTDMLYICVLDT